MQNPTPLPHPYEEHDGRPYYAVADVQDWLRTTQLGHRATAVDDALFHSSLYQMLLSHPAHAALSLLQCSTGFEAPSLDSSTEVLDALTASFERAADSTPTAVSRADINEAAELVTEAAFTPAAALARLAHDLGAQRQVLLSSRFSARVTSALKEAFTVADPAPPIIPTDEYSLGLVADLVRSLTEPISLTIGYRKECAPASLSGLNWRAATWSSSTSARRSLEFFHRPCDACTDGRSPSVLRQPPGLARPLG